MKVTSFRKAFLNEQRRRSRRFLQEDLWERAGNGKSDRYRFRPRKLQRLKWNYRKDTADGLSAAASGEAAHKGVR